MKSLSATIRSIQSSGKVNLLTLTHSSAELLMLTLELGASIKVASKVELTAKPTSVAISKRPSDELSFENQLASKIVSIKSGEILTVLTLEWLDIEIESVITTVAFKKLNLKIGDNVTALIKSSSISISRMIDE